MKPEQKTRTIIYWDCGVEGHNHKLEHTAQFCIDRRISKEEKDDYAKKTKEIVIDRDIYMLIMCLNGSTFSEIGFKYDLSTERIRQIVRKIKRKIAYHFESERTARENKMYQSTQESRDDKEYWFKAIESFQSRRS